MPCGAVPAAVHEGLPVAVYVHTSLPHAVPPVVQSISFKHAIAAAFAERVHPKTDRPMATTVKARLLNFMARTS
jgi:hypothetical protein